MAYNGSGTFNLYSPGNPVVTGTTISSSWANSTLSDIATGLSTAVCKDGQTTITANIPMSNFKLTGLAAGTGSGQSVRYEQVVGTYLPLSGGTMTGAIINVFSTGDVKLTLKTTADTGWVLMDDGTIGNGSSGGTTRANADTVDLFTLLWNNTANAQCAVSTGRGANAAADFAANKTIALPKALGRALAVYGAGSGLTSRVLALAIGDENLQSHTHTGTTGTESANHTHGIDNFPTVSAGTFIATSGGSSGAFTQTTNQSASHTHSFTSATAGTGAAQNMQPTSFLNVMIKL